MDYTLHGIDFSDLSVEQHIYMTNGLYRYMIVLHFQTQYETKSLSFTIKPRIENFGLSLLLIKFLLDPLHLYMLSIATPDFNPLSLSRSSLQACLFEQKDK